MRATVSTVLFAAGAAALGALAWWGRAGAEGIPSTDPLYYSGHLGDSLDGTRSVVLYLWSNATASDSASKKCETVSPTTPVVRGAFRVALDPTCLAAVRATPDLWIEPVVGGVSLGRRKLGAVPYAVEAERAAAASGVLEARIAALEQQVAALSQGAGRVVQTGVVDTGVDQPGWTLLTGMGDRFFRLPVKFPKPFPRPPTVVAALSGVDIINMFNARLELTTEAVTAEGFTAVVRTWADAQIYSANVTWTAVQQ